jgi:co-chaperonin GroES (HSP10)
MNLKPVGNKIIVLPIQTEHFKTESGLTVVQSELTEGKIVEMSDDFKGVYNIGDTILYPKNAGNGIFYNGEAHVFLNGTGAPQGDVWAIISSDHKIDKQDSL